MGLARLLSYLVGVVFVVLPFWTLLSTWAGDNFGHLYGWKLLPDIIIFIAGLGAIWLALGRQQLRRLLGESWIARLYILYVLLHFTLAIWALKHNEVNRSAAIDGIITNLRFIGFFAVCLIISATDSFLIKNWVRLTLWPATAVIIFGLAQRFILPLNFLSHFGYGPKTVAVYQTVDAGSGPPRLQSTLRGPNPLGAYLSLIIPAWVAVFWRRWIRLFLIGLASVIVLGFSYSRSAMAGTAAAAGLMAWWCASRLQKRWLVAAAALVLVAGSTGLYIERDNLAVQQSLLHTSSKSTSPKTSNVVRREALRKGFSDAIHHPLGRGPGTAGPASTHNDKPARIAENYYVQIAQEVGVLGVAMFVSINILVAVRLWKLRESILPRMLLATLAGITIINLVSHAWADQTLALLWWGMTGVALAPRQLKGASWYTKGKK